MNILSETFYSNDGQSCKSVAFYSLKQSAIETLYNIEDTEDFTAWGTQTIQDNNINIQHAEHRFRSTMKKMTGLDSLLILETDFMFY